MTTHPPSQGLRNCWMFPKSNGVNPPFLSVSHFERTKTKAEVLIPIKCIGIDMRMVVKFQSFPMLPKNTRNTSLVRRRLLTWTFWLCQTSVYGGNEGMKPQHKTVILIQHTIFFQAYVLTIVNTDFCSSSFLLSFFLRSLLLTPFGDTQEAEILFHLIFWHN